MVDAPPVTARAHRGWLCALALSCAVLASALPTPARAEPWEYFAVRAELGLGAMLPDFQRDQLAYGVALGGTLRVGVRPISPLVIQAHASSFLFPSESGDGAQHSFGGGLRLEPRIDRVGRLFFDGNLGAALSGDVLRFGFDFGVGFEFAIGDAVGVGPFARYSHTLATDGDFPSDAIYLVGGISIALRGEEASLPEGDRDGDGFADGADVCPDLAAGERPDPQRTGCPLGDRDGDGVADREDLCPDLAAGEHPDPDRRGCPAADTDGDSVRDAEDLCPTVPRGAHPDPSRSGCPQGDTDGDTVRDGADLCPTVHRGMHPDPERLGCPLPDRDGDSVPDRPDACPDEPGAPHPDPARNGCPGLVRVSDGQIRILQPVFFETNRDVIRARSRPVLQAVADALIATPEITQVRIEGHTDDRGAEEANLDLSSRRALNVMAWLIRAGVAPSRLEARGFGESRPLIRAETPDARATNRRVELHIGASAR
jgi:outer membrane protein OmpA-like peptidoglycan-associated protein